MFQETPGPTLLFHFCLNSSSPGLPRSTYTSTPLWSPAKSYSCDGISWKTEYMSNPSPSAPSYLKCDWTGWCSSIKIFIGDCIRPKDHQYPSKTSTLEHLQFPLYGLCHFPWFRAIEKSRLNFSQTGEAWSSNLSYHFSMWFQHAKSLASLR